MGWRMVQLTPPSGQSCTWILYSITLGLNSSHVFLIVLLPIQQFFDFDFFFKLEAAVSKKIKYLPNTSLNYTMWDNRMELKEKYLVAKSADHVDAMDAVALPGQWCGLHTWLFGWVDCVLRCNLTKLFYQINGWN